MRNIFNAFIQLPSRQVVTPQVWVKLLRALSGLETAPEISYLQQWQVDLAEQAISLIYFAQQRTNENVATYYFLRILFDMVRTTDNSLLHLTCPSYRSAFSFMLNLLKAWGPTPVSDQLQAEILLSVTEFVGFAVQFLELRDALSADGATVKTLVQGLQQQEHPLIIVAMAAALSQFAKYPVFSEALVSPESLQPILSSLILNQQVLPPATIEHLKECLAMIIYNADTLGKLNVATVGLEVAEELSMQLGLLPEQ